MQKILIILVIFLTAAAFSCNSGKVKNDGNTNKSAGTNFNPYFPVAAGNKWIYVNESPRDETELFTVEAKDIKKTEGGIQLKVTSFPYLTKDNTERTIKVSNTGEIQVSDYMGTSGVIFPAAENFKESYTWSFGIFKGTIAGMNAEAVTEDGTYNGCVYVKMTDGFTFSYEMWFKKDIGIVKWGANRTNPPTLNLIYYVLKEHKVN